MIVLFWTIIAVIIAFQLLAVDEYDISQAAIYSITIAGSFAIYVHWIFRRIVKQHIENKGIAPLAFRILMVCVLASVVLSLEDYVIESLFDKDWEGHKETILPQFFGMLLATILISGIAYAFELYEHHIETLKATQILKDTLNDLEVKNIRQQLSPHFTFNILNNLQFLIQKDKEEALQLLSQYSKILRYYVYESQHKAILLNDEVAFLKTYLELEKDRLEDGTKMEVDIAIEPNDLKIAPFILSAFIENCFKHLSAEQKWIRIFIDLKEKHLSMRVENTFKPVNTSNNKQGVGLEQARKRLELIYPHKHTLKITTIENVFSVRLDIKFD